MFANNNLAVMNFAFPDVCATPGGPMPLANIAMSSTHIPSVPNVIVGGGLAENMMTMGTVSNGDEAGLGAASGTMLGPDRPMLGSSKVFFGPAPATGMSGPCSQNSGNADGFSATPGQTLVALPS